MPDFSESFLRMVLDEVADGKSLAAVAREFDVRPLSLSKALSSDRFSDDFARAKECGADVRAGEIIDIADNDPDSHRARNRIDARKWYASKIHARQYGDRLDLNVNQTVSIGSAMAEARARLRPMSDQRTPALSQIIDAEVVKIPGPTDNQSVLTPVERKGTDEK